MSFPAIKQRVIFNYSESLEKSQKSGSSLHTVSSVKTHYLMTDASELLCFFLGASSSCPMLVVDFSLTLQCLLPYGY